MSKPKLKNNTMKTFTSVLAALIVAPILLIGGCTVMFSLSAAETERETRRCMAQGYDRSTCLSAQLEQSTTELNDALNDLGKTLGH